MSPTLIEYSKNITLNTKYELNCSCFYETSSEWFIYEVDPLWKNITRQINLATSSAISITELFISNGTLKYGLYQFIYQLIITTNYPVPILSSITGYIQIVPTGIRVSAFNDYNIFDNKLTVGPLDSLSFIPAYYSYDIDGFIDASSLSYTFYCISIDKNTTNLSNFTHDLYSLQPTIDLNEKQINATDTCFKTMGITYFIALKISFYE